jgi:hypothetical protein
MKKIYYIFFALLIVGIFSCTSDSYDYGLGNFRIDFATVTETSTGRYLVTDNNVSLTPNTSLATSLTKGSRVIVNYKPTEKSATNEYKVSLNSIALINTSQIKPLTASIANDPILAEGVWQMGDWLNMRIAYEYFDKKHSVEMMQRSTLASDTIYLEFRHSKNGDSAGYWVKTYCSYSLKAFAKTGKSVPIKLKVNDAKAGAQYFTFNYTN